MNKKSKYGDDKYRSFVRLTSSIADADLPDSVNPLFRQALIDGRSPSYSTYFRLSFGPFSTTSTMSQLVYHEEFVLDTCASINTMNLDSFNNFRNSFFKAFGVDLNNYTVEDTWEPVLLNGEILQVDCKALRITVGPLGNKTVAAQNITFHIIDDKDTPNCIGIGCFESALLILSTAQTKDKVPLVPLCFLTLRLLYQ